jgi:hypothetical protein
MYNLILILFLGIYCVSSAFAQVGMPTISTSVSDDDSIVYNPYTTEFSGAEVTEPTAGKAKVTITGDVSLPLSASSLTMPAGASETQSLIVGTAPNQFKIDANGYAYDGGINWADFEQIKEAGINWTDIQELAGSGRGGAVYSKTVTINDASPTTLWDYWQNLTGMIFTVKKVTASATSSVAGLPLLACGGDAGGAVNWGDCQRIEPLDITTKTWEGLDGINWYSMDELAENGINWTSIEQLDHIGINWIDMTSPTAVRVSIWGNITGAGN